MANNPIIYNDGGLYRFADYVAQVPDFMKAEEDIVVLLQIMSDYLNNAYRNIDVVEKFEFKFVSVDSNLASIQNQVNKLVNLFKRCEDRSEKVLFLSKPEGNPIDSSRPLYVEYIDYDGILENVDPSIITIPISAIHDGDKFYLNFIKDGEENNSGVYVYNKLNNTLLLDKNGTSQDPFNNTPDKPMKTAIGLAPRIMQFDVSELSKVYVRKAKTVGNMLYYDIYFSARISNLEDITSVNTLQMDIDGDNILENILIDYYGIVNNLPSVYDEDFKIQFAKNCTDFDWKFGYGTGMFYARDLTQFERTSTNTKQDNKNKYVDPLFSPNTHVLKIINIKGIGSNKIEIEFNSAHKLSVNDKISVKDTSLFNGKDYSVTTVVSTYIIQASTSPVNIIGNENGGLVVVRNLYYSKQVDDVNKYKTQLPYDSFKGIADFNTGDRLVRINREFPEVNATFDSTTQIIANNDLLYFDRFDGFSENDTIVFRLYDNNTLPYGLIEGTPYNIQEISNIDVAGEPKIGVKLTDQELISVGTSVDASIEKVNRYFNTNNINYTTGGFIVNDINGLNVDDMIRFSGESYNIDLPTPLDSTKNYIIETIDKNTSTITLVDTKITSSPSSNVIVNLIKMEQSKSDIAVVESNNVLQPFTNGTLLLRITNGDMISSGEIMRVSSQNHIHDKATANINSTAIAWLPDIGIQYVSGSFVVYNGIRYRVKITHSRKEGESILVPSEDDQFIVDMSDIIKRDTIIDNNPYMFGMYSIKSLGYDDVPDYTQPFSKLSNSLYIKKATDLKLKYGHEQREFIFDPRLAPTNKLLRNGFIEIINSDLDNDPYDASVNKFIKANTESSMLLSGVNDIINNINSININGNIVTVITENNHLFETGINVTIDGVAPNDYNGTYTITVLSDKMFTYEINSSPSMATVGTSTATYTQNITRNIVSITRVGDTAYATVGSKHGYTDHTTVTINGADQSGYNGTFDIIVQDEFTFSYIVNGSEVTPATTLTTITSTYTPVINEFISVINQYDSADNGIYIIKENNWVKYDDSKLPSPITIFARQNLFDITTQNPAISKDLNIRKIKSMSYIGNRKVKVTTYESHLYTDGSVINITGSIEPVYNGRFHVIDDPSSTAVTFIYEIEGGVIPSSPATGNLYVQADAWYKYELLDIEWQKKTNYNSSYMGKVISDINGNGSNITVNTIVPHEFNVGDNITIYVSPSSPFNGTYTINNVESTTRFSYIGGVIGTEIIGNVYKGFIIPPNQNKDNIGTLFGEYKFTMNNGNVFDFKDGDIVTVQDQFLDYENGIYRVQDGAIWKHLNKRLVMKVRNITVDVYEDVEYTGLEPDDSPYIYRRFRDDEVNDYIESNFNGLSQVYKLENTYAANFSFAFEAIDEIDTAGPFHKQYNAKFDYNSVTDRTSMNKDFNGVADMGYPLVEKFERLAYLKDPNVIDIEFIEYLARYMGYDITALYEDIEESNVYKTDKQRESALRETIENLPQYYALKSTSGGLEMLLLTFGIVGEVVTMWTRQEDPYADMIPDYELRGLQTAENEAGINSGFVPTPHFMVKVNIEGNFDNQLLPDDQQRIIQQIKSFKPINDVFDGIYRYIQVKLNARISSNQMRSTGRMTGTIGYDNMNFDDNVANNCI